MAAVFSDCPSIYVYSYINKLYDTVSSHNAYDHLMYILEVKSKLLHVMHVANVILVSTGTHIIGLGLATRATESVMLLRPTSLLMC